VTAAANDGGTGAIEAPAELAAVRPGEHLDWVALETYLRERLGELDDAPALDGPMVVEQFPNGSANLTYLLRFGACELVMRRPPFGVVAPGAHDMRREFRVLSKLWRHWDKAPRGYLFCNDHDVIGSDFVVMERRVGDVIRLVVPPSMTHHRDVGRRVGLALVDAMAEMHVLDPASCGVGDLGRPDGFVTRQVSGWKQRWDLVRPEPDDPATSAAVAAALPLMDEVYERLLASIPPSQRASIVHNDLKLDNCQFVASDPDRVGAIFDWDMATLGDPLIDLGTLLGYWPDPSDPPDSPRGTPALGQIGLPSRKDVTQRYVERTGFDAGPIAWHEAFAMWKTAVVVQQLYRRWARGESTDERMSLLADRIPNLVATARAVLRDAS